MGYRKRGIKHFNSTALQMETKMPTMLMETRWRASLNVNGLLSSTPFLLWLKAVHIVSVPPVILYYIISQVLLDADGDGHVGLS